MIIDAFQLFSQAQDFTGIAAGTIDGTNILDYGIVSGIPSSANGGGARDMGATGDEPRLFAKSNVAFVGGTSLQVVLKGAIDNGSGLPAAFSTWWSSPVYTTAQLTQGARLFSMDFPRPPQGVAIPRFVKMSYVTVGVFTAGQIWAGVILDRDDQAYSGTDNSILGGYPAGITVAN